MSGDPLVDWRDVSTRPGASRLLHGGDPLAVEVAHEARVFFEGCKARGFRGVELAWRPPFECVTDRLLQGPPQRLPGVLRACVEMGWMAADATKSEWILRHAFDLPGDEPAAEDVRRMRCAVLKVLDMLVEKGV